MVKRRNYVTLGGKGLWVMLWSVYDFLGSAGAGNDAFRLNSIMFKQNITKSQTHLSELQNSGI